MSPTGPERRFAAMWTPLEAGALLRLSIAGNPLSVAWSHPSRGEWATGVGVAGEGGGAIDWVDGPPPSLPGPWFGGWTFAGAERWVLPQVLAWWSGGRTYAAAFGDRAAELLKGLHEAEPVIEVPHAMVDEGDRAAWAAMIEAALGRISAGALSKVVLARRLMVRAEAPFEERRILKVLEARYPSCRTFLLRTAEGAAFVGATPETLCRVRGRVLETEALAGTGSGEELLSSVKDRREHAWVVEAIVESLRPFTVSVDVEEEPGLKRLANVTHLWTPIRAQLREDVEPIAAARALHPTPAVGGTPRAEAIAFQRAHEGFERGWYAGAIGARGADSLELCVGIRSALVEGRQAIVYAGAGIVEGSTADSEWAETERKASALLGALGVEAGAQGPVGAGPVGKGPVGKGPVGKGPVGKVPEESPRSSRAESRDEGVQSSARANREARSDAAATAPSLDSARDQRRRPRADDSPSSLDSARDERERGDRHD